MRKIKKGLLTICLTLLMIATFAWCFSCTDAKGVTISFNTNGGSSILDESLEEGTSFVLPTPEREGYSFEGWYTSSDFSGAAVTEIVAGENMTFYAKWEQMYLVTLDLNGGNLDVSSLYLKAGANVYNAVKTLIPTKTDYEFGAWFVGENELGANTRMTEAALTLKAEYKIKYVVECYEQTLALDGYQKSEQEYVGYAYVGSTVLAEQALTGFYEVDHADTVRQKEIKSTVAENVFKLYFDREEYEVTFYSNAPDGSSQSETYNVLFGKDLQVPYNYTADGYCLLGWATSTTGNVAYEANYIDIMLGKDGVTPEKVSPSRDMALYGVWLKAYVDMFGNSDYLYLTSEEVTVGEASLTVYNLYLCRGGAFFEGEYEEETGDFYFEHNGKTLMEGRLHDDGKFIYKNSARADYVSTKYEFGYGLNELEKIKFDQYNGITYITTDENSLDTESTGTYYINDEGYYVATFTSGALAGETFTMTVGYVRDSSTGTYVSAYQVRNDAEIELGSLVRFGFYQGQKSYYTDGNGPVYDITLNGFGSAHFNLGGGEYETYYYILDDDGETLYLYDTNSGSLIGTTKIIYDEQFNKTGYMFYEKNLDGTYGYGDGTITLDGVCNAVYETEEGKVNGYFTHTTSVFGGTLVTVTANGNTYTMLITITQTNVGDYIMTSTSVDEKLATYAEFYYIQESTTETKSQKVDQTKIYYAPLLTINNVKQGDAILYGYTDASTYEKISEGTYTYDKETGLYTYQASTFYDAQVNTSIMDLSTVQTMVFSIDSSATNYNVHYWYSYTTEEGTTERSVSYASADGTQTLLLVSGMAIYKENGAIIAMGTYSKTYQSIEDEQSDKVTYSTEGMLTLTTSDNTYYFEVYEDTGALIKLEHKPYSLRLLKEDGNNINSSETLYFDGKTKDGATYTVVSGDDSAEYVGKFEKIGETPQGYYIFRFYAEAKGELTEQEFKFIVISDHGVFAKYNETYNGIYQSEEYGKLELDGFGYLATYTDVDGYTYTDKYFIENENEIKFTVGEAAFVYFDLKGEKSFALRGTEYGTYLYMNNQLFDDVLFKLDGYGSLTVCEMVEDPENEGSYVEKEMGSGTYKFDNEWVTFTYTLTGSDEPIVLYGQLGYYYYDSSTVYNTFFEYNEEVKATYVNTADYTVMQLDGFGNATVYGNYGVVEYGHYTLVTDTLLYYVNSSSTDASLYVYDAVKGTAAPVSLKARGYYTQNLESLLFTKYGFAIFNGQTRYFYYIDDNDNVTIYREAEEGEEANAYGFVTENFGAFSDTKEYGNKLYYASEKSALVFDRQTDNAANYPINGNAITKLTFAPTGDGEFSVRGIVTIGSKNYDCTVVRNVLDDGTVDFYVTVDFYRFDILVDYQGDMDENRVNTYRITKMSQVIVAPSNKYLMYYYLYNMFVGADAANALENSYGTVSIIAEYDQNGNITQFYFNGEFADDSKMYDTEGELVESLTGLKIYDAEGKLVESFDELVKSIKNSENSIYKVSAECKGYTYHLYFSIYENGYTSGYGYSVYAFVREEVLTCTAADEKEYTVTFERVIASDASMSAGSCFKASIVCDTAEVKGHLWYEQNGYFYYIVRTYDEDTGLVTSSLYYKLELVEAPSGDQSVEENKTNVIPVYASLKSVTVEKVNTIYADGDNTSYIDVNEDTGEVMLLAISGQPYIVMESSYDATTRTYTVSLSETLTYSVVVAEDGQSVTITQVVETEEEAD